jgi:eukaryotic-like serine/threonine-protein kinase
MTTAPFDVLRAALSDRYRIDRELGRGGMATVYLAHDLKHDRPVALKVLNPELAQAVGPERFQREIRFAARLQHPHVLTVLDSGDAAGQLWFTMPFVDGESLRDRIRREGQLSLDEALRIARETALALQYAHEQGIVHRDIKPENLLLTKDGSTLVADFGVARALAAGESLTQTGMAVGTPAYMSPEQATGESSPDARTDLYSLGCVLYEMLAGEPPFTGPNAQAVIAKRFSTTATPLHVVRPDVTPAIETVVDKALARVPAARFASAAEMGRLLQPSAATPVGTPTVQTVITPRGPSRRVAALFGAAATVGLISVAAFLLRPATVHRPMVSRQFTYSGMALYPAVSPDGRSVAYVAGGRSLVVQQLEGGEPVVLVPPTRALAWPRWTADGRTIVFVMMRDSTELMATYAIPAGGGQARKVLEDQLPLDTGPDSTTIVRIPREHHRIEIVDWRTGHPVKVVALPPGAGEGVSSVYLSPNRRLFAVEEPGGILIVSDSSSITLGQGVNARWSSRSDALYFVRGAPGAEAIFRVPVDPRTGKPGSKPVIAASLPGLLHFDLAAGRLVYVIGATSVQARALMLEGRPARVATDRTLTSGTAPVSSIAISPDGRTVAFSQIRGGDANLYTMDFDRGSPQPLAGSSTQEAFPAFSSDGVHLAYVRTDSAGVRTVFVSDLHGGTRARFGSAPISTFVSALGTPVRPRWSADGRHLSYPTTGFRHVALVDVAQGIEASIVVPDSVGSTYAEAVPAPDGRRVAVSTLRRMTDWGEVWIGAVDGSGWTRARTPFGENHPVAWTADGWIYYVNHRAMMGDHGSLRTELWRARGPTGEPELVIPLPDGCGETDVSADGRRLVCMYFRTDSDVYVATDFDPELPAQ